MYRDWAHKLGFGTELCRKRLDSGGVSHHRSHPHALPAEPFVNRCVRVTPVDAAPQNAKFALSHPGAPPAAGFLVTKTAIHKIIWSLRKNMLIFEHCY